MAEETSGEGEVVPAIDDAEEEVEDHDTGPSFSIDDVALQYSRDNISVRAGDSICYNHKIMRERGVVTTKIVRVRGPCDLELENGDVLCEADLVKVISASENGASPVYKQLNEHCFVFPDSNESQVNLPLQNVIFCAAHKHFFVVYCFYCQCSQCNDSY